MMKESIFRFKCFSYFEGTVNRGDQSKIKSKNSRAGHIFFNRNKWYKIEQWRGVLPKFEIFKYWVKGPDPFPVHEGKGSFRIL